MVSRKLFQPLCLLPVAFSLTLVNLYEVIPLIVYRPSVRFHHLNYVLPNPMFPIITRISNLQLSESSWRVRIRVRTRHSHFNAPLALCSIQRERLVARQAFENR